MQAGEWAMALPSRAWKLAKFFTSQSQLVVSVTPAAHPALLGQPWIVSEKSQVSLSRMKLPRVPFFVYLANMDWGRPIVGLALCSTQGLPRGPWPSLLCPGIPTWHNSKKGGVSKWILFFSVLTFPLPGLKIVMQA